MARPANLGAMSVDALLKLVDEPITKLKQEAPLRAPYFDALLNPDESRNLLLWLNDPPGAVSITVRLKSCFVGRPQSC